MNLGFTGGLFQDGGVVGVETKNEFHFPHGMSHLVPESQGDPSVGLEQFPSGDFNGNGSGTNHLSNNLTEWQNSEIRGLTQAGIQCLLDSWLSLAKNPIEGKSLFFFLRLSSWDHNPLVINTLHRSCIGLPISL
ncbi:unnamed protein product [Allacma fusca]|uniref:Uncharacterized protein n=1 Tax=Allacma fusca TaxID=39272 RepID=A0A8J2K4J3_9HEXA|nr:unnamed protein product [Allacma fusca]